MSRTAAPGYVLPPQLTVAQSAEVARDALRALGAAEAPWRVECGELRQFDSACLALLMELRRNAGDAGLELLGVPERLRHLAQAYGVGFVLDGEPGVPAAAPPGEGGA